MKLLLNVRYYDRALRVACVIALVALGLVVWSLLDERALPVVVAMSVGQVLGTLSLLIYLAVVLADLRRVRITDAPTPSLPPPPP
jgi:hypothetical protein